jgi:FixJ family two-component response regulator
MSVTPLVHVVDDDPGIRDGLTLLLRSVAIEVRGYADADAFLAGFVPQPGRPACVLLDVRIPGMSGMTLLERLRAEHPSVPVVMITGHGDIDMAVRAMKLGAADFVTKPFAAQALIDRVQQTLLNATGGPRQLGHGEALRRWETLTPREREIFDGIVSGAPNKSIAADLGISIRTVESHRARIMEKTGAKTLVDLVLLSVTLKSAHGAVPE